ncbi:MAG TPA: tRNA pseudouridine(38-40) synthase TruA [Candidatus Cloacimonadota bacterium]|nr:tRNA pseudouridine(38-40) synthase TruA [Candidatus Cloacimonadota bacterium]HOV16871.1 tRNA pseudouridine(38-40) synthase TruA [Candidatus Cloacimonadota bacterium]HQL14530.1 tRNA pseudouridine(38-40) synthase TruA [Candidatus Cloacimonadota bacterium]
MTAQRFLMKVAYDGTDFGGWQMQKHQRTVQSVLQKALYEFSGHKTPVTGSGRTDAGVHAWGQYAHFDYRGTATAEQMQKGLKRFLPPDVQILKIIPVPPDFHARYDAMERCYQYIITLKPTPFNRLYEGSFPRKKIRIELMQKAAPFFLGTHDFSSFSKENPAVPDHVCTVVQSDFEIYQDRYIYTIRADRFLHNMVRRIVGALVNIGHFDLEPSIVETWLQQKQARQTLIFPAPPQGLYLMDVRYPEEKLNPELLK